MSLIKHFFTVMLLLSLLAPVGAFARQVTLGLILVGPHDDKGYSQAQYEGGKYVERQLDGAKMVYLDKVNPADWPNLTVPQVADGLIALGANLIIAGSDDMKDGIREAAAQHPDVAFVHVSGDDVWTGKAPGNLGNLFGKMIYAKMMAGFVAALTTRTGKIGCLAPLINGETRRLVVSAYLGARYAWTEVLGRNPKDLKFKVDWIGFWFNIPGVTADPTRVADAFYDSGYDVVLSGIDTPEVVNAAWRKRNIGREVWALPYDYVNACDGQGGVCLGVPYFNWGPGFLRIARAVADGTWKPGFEWDAPYWRDINSVDLSPVGFAFGPGLDDAATAKLEAFIKRLGSGSLNLFTGPLRYQDGSVFLKPGEKATDKQIWYVEQLLEGMEGLSKSK